MTTQDSVTKFGNPDAAESVKRRRLHAIPITSIYSDVNEKIEQTFAPIDDVLEARPIAT